MKYHFKIHKEGTGFWTECIELKGCYTQGTTIKELEENIEDALHTYFDDPVSISFPKLSSEKSDSVVEVSVNSIPN